MIRTTKYLDHSDGCDDCGVRHASPLKGPWRVQAYGRRTGIAFTSCDWFNLSGFSPVSLARGLQILKYLKNQHRLQPPLRMYNTETEDFIMADIL